jgi:hypothetical protein
MRLFLCLVLQFLIPVALFAQGVDPNSSIASCSFADGNEVSVRYTPVSTKQKLPLGKVWAPGGTPIYLFTQTEIIANNASIPVGAYSIYLIPGKQNWTLIVNKNVSTKDYDEKQDLVRVNMENGTLSEALDPLQVSFAHVAPRQCNIRVYYGKSGNFADFNEK